MWASAWFGSSLSALSRLAFTLPQGNESGLTRRGSEALGEIVWVPSGDFASQLDAFLVGCGADQVDGEVSDDRHVFCAMTFAQARLVVGEDDVEHRVRSKLMQSRGTAQ